MAAQERGSGLAASERRRRYDNDRAALWMSRPELHVPGDPKATQARYQDVTPVG